MISNRSRLKRHQKNKTLMAEINVVPYIDVMLVLLVIFMITAPLLTQGIHVNLPQAQAKALSAKEQLPIIVSVNKAGQLFLNISNTPKQAIADKKLSEQVSVALNQAKQKNNPRQVYVKGDRDVPYGKIVQAMALLQQAGAPEVGLITRQTNNS